MSEIGTLQYDTAKDKVFAPEHKLLETKSFIVSADDNPICEGHLLIIPKENISCVGEFSDETMMEFTELYDRMKQFIRESYGSVSTFEHGRVGQTIYHAHVHLLPFGGQSEDIIPENKLTEISGIQNVKSEYTNNGQYLFFSIEDKSWLADTSLGAPRVLRDRFAKALGDASLGDWKKSQKDLGTQLVNQNRIHLLEQKWKQYIPKHT